MKFAFCLLALTGSFVSLRAETSYPMTVQQSASISSSGKSFAPVGDLHSTLEIASNHYVTVPGKDPNGWSFTLEPYLWALGMSGDIGVIGLPAINVNFSPTKILQHLDWGVMGKGEVRKGRWGVLGDGLFAQLSASGDPPAPLYENVSLKVQRGLASLAVAYRVVDDRRGYLDMYAGARYNYLGFNITTAIDFPGIQNVSNAAVQGITNLIGQRVESFVASNADAIQAVIVDQVANVLTAKVLAASANFDGDLLRSVNKRDLMKVVSQLQSNSGAYRELIASVALAKIAAAQNKLTPAIQNQVTQAQKKVAKALAKRIEATLPTAAEGSQWWVDPIIGLRGQINFTRWLFLAAQGDVGGFGAASDIAWNVQATIGVNFTRNLFGELGYRYLYMDYQNEGFRYNVSEAGIFSGFGVRF